MVTAYFQTANICKILLQIVLAKLTANYYLWAVVELFFGILYSIILNYKINKVYPWLRSNIKLGRRLISKYPDVIKYTKQLFVHKIGSVVHTQISPFLVYAFASLQTVAYYGNYTLIVTKLDGLVNNLLGSTSAAVGNLIAEGNQTKILKIYWELMAIRFCIATVFIFALYKLLPPFIELWLGSQYILPGKILILILITYFLGLIRGTNEQFILGYGLFYDIWSPFVEALILISVAIIGGRLWGFPGVLLGNITSSIIIIYIWKPYMLFNRGFKLSIWRYWGPWILHLALMAISMLISHWILLTINCLQYINSTWGYWLLSAVIIVTINVFVTLSLFLIGTVGMRDFVKRIMSKFQI